jgi:hypothetical protein
MRKHFHKILFIGTIAVMVVFLVQTFTGVVRLEPLHGVTIETEKPRLTLTNYVDGSFQSNADKYLQEHFGFREWLIRAYNQYLWSFFRETSNSYVVRGKKDWLYEDVQVRDHYESLMYQHTEDTAAMRKTFETEALRLWKVQQLLEEYNIHLFVIINPGKNVIYPEYLPKNRMFFHPEGIHAYDYYKRMFDKLGINYIDNVAVFQKAKDSVDYPLYSKTGAHWSNIASIYVFDSIIRYMENLGDQNLVNLDIGEKYQAKPRQPDNDLEELLNLFFPIKTQPYWYAYVKAEEDTTAVKPYFLTIGDSYFWNFVYNIPLQDIFRYYPYWYYNYIVHFDSANTATSDLDLEQELMRTDYIMLTYSTTQLYDLGSKFLSRALLHLCYDKAAIESAAHCLVSSIRSNPKLYAKILEYAKESQKNLEEVLYGDAVYLLLENPEEYFEDLKGNHLPVSRNKDLVSIRKKWSANRP